MLSHISLIPGAFIYVNAMKKSIYYLNEKISDDIFLYFSSMSNSFLLINKDTHTLFEKCNNENLTSLPPKIFKALKENMFIVSKDCNEIDMAMKRRKVFENNQDVYNIIINPTLDCNLSCWYCYENHIKDSKISHEIINAIKQNIKYEYSTNPFNVLKISFFGGEPFLYFKAIQNILNFADEFCKDHNLELIADFTTNATLLTKDIIIYLKQFRSHFQITLDGNEEHHNKIKVDNTNPQNTYRRSIESLRLIYKYIPNHYIAVRINFDNQTLRGIDSILNDIDFLDRRSSYIILKKVWQLKVKDMDKEALIGAIQKVFERNFLPDYYVMPKGCVCFAERRRQALINYDGGVFKCTTISSFDTHNSLGQLNTTTGKITWDGNKIHDWFVDMQPDYCKECKWFPICLGCCNRQLMAHKGEHICTFDAFNLTQKEYLLYLYRYNLLYHNLYLATNVEPNKEEHLI